MRFKRLLQKIPNLLSLVNMSLGAIASIYILQSTDIVQIHDMVKYEFEVRPSPTNLNGLIQAAFLVIIASFIDFFDGFLARYLEAESDIGGELDSLSDMITFGLVPGLVFYTLIGEAYRLNPDAMSYTALPFYFGLLVTLFSALRLAKFNVDDEQSHGFKGLPTPAAAIFVVSLPLVLFVDRWGFRELLMNRWVLFGLVAVISYLLTSNLAMFSLKFKHFSWSGNEVRYLFLLFIIASLVIAAMAAAIYIAIPVIIIVYIISSLLFNVFNYEV